MSFYQDDRGIKIGVKVQLCCCSPGSVSHIPASSISSSMTVLVSWKRLRSLSQGYYDRHTLDWKLLVQMRDRPNQRLITTLLHLYLMICGDVPQTILCSFGGNLNSLDDFLEISSKSKTWLESILDHHSGNHLVHRVHRRLRIQSSPVALTSSTV